MVIAEPTWLHTLGQIAGTLLLIELVLVLLVVCALMIAIAIATWWVRSHLIPIVDQYGGEAQRLLGVAERGSDRVAHGVAEFHGRWEGVQATIRGFIFGRRVTALPPGTGTMASDETLDAPRSDTSALPAPDDMADDAPVASIEANGHTPPIPPVSRYVG